MRKFENGVMDEWSMELSIIILSTANINKLKIKLSNKEWLNLNY